MFFIILLLSIFSIIIFIFSPIKFKLGKLSGTFLLKIILDLIPRSLGSYPKIRKNNKTIKYLEKLIVNSKNLNSLKNKILKL